jgi:hypothetical protein
MSVSIDGISLDNAQIEQHRQTSTSYFTVPLPASNVLVVTPIANYDSCVSDAGVPCSNLWTQDGYYITLDDLSVGTHVLQFQAQTPGNPALQIPSFSLDVTDTLNVVVPEPSTLAMMLVGFAGLGFASRRWGKRAGLSVASAR